MHASSVLFVCGQSGSALPDLDPPINPHRESPASQLRSAVEEIGVLRYKLAQAEQMISELQESEEEAQKWRLLMEFNDEITTPALIEKLKPRRDGDVTYISGHVSISRTYCADFVPQSFRVIHESADGAVCLRFSLPKNLTYNVEIVG